METGDILALGIVVFFVVLGALGTFRWTIDIASGVLIGLLILGCIAFIAGNPRFEQLTDGVFKGGKIIPYLQEQIDNLKDLIFEQTSFSSAKIELPESGQESDAYEPNQVILKTFVKAD